MEGIKSKIKRERLVQKLFSTKKIKEIVRKIKILEVFLIILIGSDLVIMIMDLNKNELKENRTIVFSK